MIEKIEISKYDKNDYLNENEKIAEYLEKEFNARFNENIEIIFIDNEFKIYKNEKFIDSAESYDLYDLKNLFNI